MSNIPENVLIAFAALLTMIVLLIPISLRLAGLTGQQVVDVITLTLQFFVNLVKEFRTQNKTS